MKTHTNSPYRNLQVEALLRHQWVSVAAYYRSKTGASAGEWDDWFQAEAEYISMKLKSFLRKCREDGVMSIEDLRRLALSFGVADPEVYNTEADLIRQIQIACRHRPCFRMERKQLCDDSDCEWVGECQKLIAIWYR